jgi:hypothetical protein
MENVCYWDQFRQSTMVFCEERLCSLIVQPSNAFSSFFFALVGLYLHLKYRQHKGELIRIIIPICYLLGITSFLFHGSFTFLFEVFDVGSMYMLSILLITFNLKRLNWINDKAFHPIYWSLVVLSIVFMVIFKGQSGEYLFGFEMVIAAMLEAKLLMTQKGVNYKWFIASISCFAVSIVIWVLDVKKILCDPTNHILQGHAVWHLLDAIAIAFLYLHYSQFNSKNKSAPLPFSA